MSAMSQYVEGDELGVVTFNPALDAGVIFAFVVVSFVPFDQLVGVI
tara:strand:+ start:580 stop:717 length:138 start_codon:yes stop_codon:yes gene_type:complete